jgi:TRAP-type transport system periplasmic protein
MQKTVAAMIACLAIALCAEGWAGAESRKWKIGHVRPSGSAIDTDVHRLVERIATATNGAIAIEVYPGNKLGDYTVVQERVSVGDVEMFVGPFGSAIDKRLALAFTPFWVLTWEEAKRVYASDSLLFRQMALFLEAKNIKLIGGWPVYFGGIALTRNPPYPGNPDISKEMIIRVPPVRCFELTAKALGFTPYPITWTYAKMGLKTGMVQGILGGGAEGYLGLTETIRYYLPVKDHFEYWFVYINLNLWNELPEGTKAVIATAAQEMETGRWQVAEAGERSAIEQLKKVRVEVIDLSAGEHAAMKAKVRKTVWPEMQKEIGEAFVRVTGGK